MAEAGDSREYQRPWCLCPNGHWWLGWPKVVNVCTECSLGATSEHDRPSGLVAALDGIEQAATTGWSGPPTTPAQAEAMEQDCQCARCGSSCGWVDCSDCLSGIINTEDDEGFDDVEFCTTCDGSGGWWCCLSSGEWCGAHPLVGREQVERGAVEWFDIPARTSEVQP